MTKRVPLLALCFIAGCAQAQDTSVIADQIYMKSGGAAFTLDVFKAPKVGSPAVIWLVSGGWFSKHQDINPALAKAFNDAGITLVQVVHGSQPKYQLAEIVPMIRRAVRYVHANATRFGIDGNKIGISGASAGGHLSLMAAGMGDDGDPNAQDPVEKASSKVNAVGVFFPPTDFLNWGRPNYVPLDNALMSVFLPAFGVNAQTPKEKLPEVARTFSPILKITASFPPTMLIHGDKDMLVPIQQSQSFDAALAKVGVDHTFITVPGGGHDQKTVEPGLPKLIEWFKSKFMKS